MKTPPRSAKQLRAELLDAIAFAGKCRSEYVAKFGTDIECNFIPFLTGELRRSEPDLAHALAEAAGMGYLNEPREGITK